MTEPANLPAALAALQADLPQVRKGETAKVQTKQGREYSYSYANLADCTRAIMPLLAKFGLSFSAKPTLVDGRFSLVYVLRHTSGECDEGEYPLPDPARAGAQEVGSAVTYARRYTLCAVTGLAPDGDDDDAASAAAGVASRQSRAAPPPASSATRPGMVTKAQLTKLGATFTGMHITERARRLEVVSAIVSRPITSSSELTKQEATSLIDTLDSIIATSDDPAASIAVIVMTETDPAPADSHPDTTP